MTHDLSHSRERNTPGPPLQRVEEPAAAVVIPAKAGIHLNLSWMLHYVQHDDTF